MIRLLIFGPTGSMGTLISQLAFEDDEIELVAACDVSHIGEQLGILVGSKDPNNIKIDNVNNLEEIIQKSKPTVAVDFTVAQATEHNARICVENGIRCVIGTTALSDNFLCEYEDLVSKHDAPSVISPNMATGVNILFKTVSILAKYLGDWDIEVIEAHHHRKIDAPSGTALKIGQAISNSINSNFEAIARYGRSKGPNKRLVGAKNEIGVHSIRGGDIVGDHTILFAGPGERIEFKHQAHSRMCFASGAITAIKFISKAQENKIYDTNEVLGL